MFTKSGIMVGLGEERNEVLQLMDDLRSADVDFLTIGQYLQPTRKHHPVDALRHAGRVQGLRDDRLRQGLPDGLGEPADPLVPPRRRGLRAPEGRARGATGRLRPRAAIRCLSSRRRTGSPTARRTCSTSSPMSRNIPQFLPLCESLVVHSRRKDGDREILVATMTVGLQVRPRDSSPPRYVLDRQTLYDPRRVSRRAVQLSRERLALRATRPRRLHRPLHHRLRVPIDDARHVMGAVFDRAFRKFTEAFEARADAVYGTV